MNKIRSISREHLYVFNQIEKLKINYILNNNLTLLNDYLKLPYEKLDIKIDMRVYNKAKYEEDQKALSFLRIKKNINFLNKKEIELVKSFLEKVFFRTSLFDKNLSIFPYIELQKELIILLTYSNYELINKFVNQKRNNKLLQHKSEELYLILYEALFVSIYKFDLSKDTSFVTFLHTRIQSAIAKLLNDSVKDYVISKTLDYSVNRIKQVDVERSKIEEGLSFLNIFTLFKVSLTDEFDTRIYKKEVTELLNCIVNNSSKCSFLNKEFELENPREKFIKEFATFFPTEFEKIATYNTVKFIQTRIIIDILYFGKDLDSLITSKFGNETQETLEEINSSYETEKDIDRESVINAIKHSIVKDLVLSELGEKKYIIKLNKEERDYINSFIEKFGIDKPENFDYNKIKVLRELDDIIVGNEEVLSKISKKYISTILIEKKLYLDLL